MFAFWRSCRSQGFRCLPSATIASETSRRRGEADGLVCRFHRGPREPYRHTLGVCTARRLCPRATRSPMRSTPRGRVSTVRAPYPEIGFASGQARGLEGRKAGRPFCRGWTAMRAPSSAKHGGLASRTTGRDRGAVSFRDPRAGSPGVFLRDGVIRARARRVPGLADGSAVGRRMRSVNARSSRQIGGSVTLGASRAVPVITPLDRSGESEPCKRCRVPGVSTVTSGKPRRRSRVIRSKPFFPAGRRKACCRRPKAERPGLA